MNGAALVSLFVLGASLLAMWIEARWPEIGPRSLGASMLQTGLGMAAAGAVPAAIGVLLGDNPSPGRSTVVLLTVFLPGMAYTLLVALWMLKTLQSALRLR